MSHHMLTSGESGAAGFAQAIFEALSDGWAIQHARERVATSQAALARAIGVSRSYINKLETGARQANEEMVLRIWAALGRFESEMEENLRQPVLVRNEGDCAIVTREEKL